MQQQTTEHEIVLKGNCKYYHTDVKVEDHQIEVKHELVTNLHHKVEHNTVPSSYDYENKLYHKKEWPLEATLDNIIYSRKPLSDMNFHQTVKHKLEELGNDYDYNADVKVEEHPVQVKLVESYRREKKYQCQDCNKEFYNASIFLEHQKGHGHHPDNVYSCRYCSQRFDDGDQLVHHQKTLHLQFQCSHCEKYFTQKRNLDLHQLVHSKERSYQCSHCGMIFDEKFQLNEHRRTHCSKNTYQCSYCDKSFVKKDDRLKHIKVAHPDKRAFKCTQCFKGFNDPGHLARHKKIHTGEKPYHCSHCDKYFSQKAHLEQHIRIHMEECERPYQCIHCDKYFSQKNQLEKHIRIHTKCIYCFKEFNDVGQLELHKKIHTGEKPFHCNHCKKYFSRKANLSQHIRTQH